MGVSHAALHSARSVHVLPAIDIQRLPEIKLAPGDKRNITAPQRSSGY